ncbi:hypothetical protein ACH4U3_27365 [Streptomyces griseoruber]|uniref:hypothetical protein n=1 Tax=Streptomyces griseoruber TaxID=1943 RepID=UPI0037BE1372
MAGDPELDVAHTGAWILPDEHPPPYGAGRVAALGIGAAHDVIRTDGAAVAARPLLAVAGRPLLAAAGPVGPQARGGSFGRERSGTAL